MLLDNDMKKLIGITLLFLLVGANAEVIQFSGGACSGTITVSCLTTPNVPTPAPDLIPEPTDGCPTSPYQIVWQGETDNRNVFLTRNRVMSMKIDTLSGSYGSLSTVEVPGGSPRQRVVWVSRCAGVVGPESSGACMSNFGGVNYTTSRRPWRWLGYCGVNENETIYINVLNGIEDGGVLTQTCDAGEACRFAESYQRTDP